LDCIFRDENAGEQVQTVDMLEYSHPFRGVSGLNLNGHMEHRACVFPAFLLALYIFFLTGWPLV
jgi:hypothetical protein